MKKFKRVLALVLAVILAVSFTACNATGEKEEETTKAAAVLTGCDKKDVKIGVIHIGDPADGSGYSYTHDLGIQGMQANLGLEDSQIVRKLNVGEDASAVKTAIEECISDGCNIIFGTSFGYMKTMDALAKEYPNVIFSHATGSMSNDTNFNNYFGRIYQARYLAGIAAGLKTKSDKIGYVAAYGTDMAETCSGINAFTLGVQSVNPDAIVYVKELSSWSDPNKETAYADALIAMGCDVIAQHCDSANPQIAAEKAGVFGCGYNSDMTKDAPKAHLCAPIWNWDVYYTAAVSAVINGKWKEFGNYYAGIKESFVDVSPLSANCAANTKEYIDLVKGLFMDGSWDVFSGTKLSFADGKVVKTKADLVNNNGTVIVKAGDPSVDDGVIKGTMNYFVKGVQSESK